MLQISHENCFALINKRKIKFEFINNNIGKLMIILDQMSTFLKDSYFSNDIKSEDFFLNKVISEYSECYDLLIMEDLVPYVYGNFFSRNGSSNFIEHIKFINFFCEGKFDKDDVTILGYRVAGLPSLFVGLQSESIGNVIAVDPQLHNSFDELKSMLSMYGTKKNINVSYGIHNFTANDIAKNEKIILLDQKFNTLKNCNDKKVGVKILNMFLINEKKSLKRCSLFEKNTGDFCKNVNGKNIRYKFIDNGKKNLVIIFQSLAFKENEIKYFIDNKLNNIYPENVFYSFFKMSTNKKYNSDFLFISDDNSGTNGWYAYDYGEEITNYYVDFIDAFCEERYNPENVLSFGSSKGGFASILLGMKSKSIKTVISIVPQVSLSEYLNYGWKKQMLYKMCNDNLKMINRIDKILFECPTGDKNLTIFTGINDNSYNSQLKLHEFYTYNNIKHDFFCHEGSLNHTELLEFYLTAAQHIIVTQSRFDD